MKLRRSVQGQEGMASIVVVSVLIIILTLISLGFARLISRSITNSANRQFSAAATYAAQSGINDVAAYIKQYVQNNGADNFLPKSTQCNGAGSLIGNSSSPGPFYGDSNLSGDSGTRLTCILLNPTPNNLRYNQVINLKSQVVKVNTSAATGALDKLMISWQPSDSRINGYPVSLNSFYDETTWNGTTANCRNGANDASCIPVLRLTIFPTANNSSLNSIQSKTVFLYPRDPGSDRVKVVSYPDNANFQDGSIIPVPCAQQVALNTFNPSTNSDFKCNIIISSFSGAIAPANTDSVYLRLTPIYNQADIKIAANDKFGNALNFINDQAVVDVTAQTGGVAKRLQARLDTSSLAAGSNGIDTNISSGTDSIPEQTIRSATALCKRMIQTTPSNGFSGFVAFDQPDSVCHTLGGGGGPPVVQDYPVQLTFNIKGGNGRDSGLTVDSEATNIQQGTVFVGDSSNPGSATLGWATRDAETCTASVGNAGDGWAGDKTGLMTFRGSPARDGQGNQTINNINTVTEYDLVCNRPFASGPSPTKKVYAWPYPTASISGPASVEAGRSYTISWNSNNVRSSGPCTKSGDWSGDNLARIGFQDFTWPLNDSSSTRSYTVTCYDPAGRAVVSNTWRVGPGGNTNITAPSCRAPIAYVTPGANGRGSWFYQGNCPNVSPYSGGYHINSNIPGLGSGDVPAVQAVLGWGGLINSPGNYCIQLIEWVPGWTSPASPSGDTGYNCWTIYSPMSIDFDSNNGIWDNGPTECSGLAFPNNVYNGTWMCRNGTFNPSMDPPRCADRVHRFTACDMWWNVIGGSGNHTCELRPVDSTYGILHRGPENNWLSRTGDYPSGIGWINGGNPYTWLLSCTDNVSGETQNLTKNIP